MEFKEIEIDLTQSLDQAIALARLSFVKRTFSESQ